MFGSSPGRSEDVLVAVTTDNLNSMVNAQKFQYNECVARALSYILPEFSYFLHKNGPSTLQFGT